MLDAATYILARNAAKKYTDQVATQIEWKTQICNEIPDPSEADAHTIYFVPTDPEDPEAGYDEYIKVGNTMERMGSTAILPDLHKIGFMIDENDDDLLIIDCDTLYTQVTTSIDFIKYIEKYFNVTIGDEHIDNVKAWYNWYLGQNQEEKNNVYFFGYRKNSFGTIICNIYCIYSTVFPTIELDEENVYTLISYENQIKIPYGENEIWSYSISDSGSIQEYSYFPNIIHKTNTLTYSYCLQNNLVKDDLNLFNNLVIKEE